MHRMAAKNQTTNYDGPRTVAPSLKTISDSGTNKRIYSSTGTLRVEIDSPNQDALSSPQPGFASPAKFEKIASVTSRLLTQKRRASLHVRNESMESDDLAKIMADDSLTLQQRQRVAEEMNSRMSGKVQTLLNTAGCRLKGAMMDVDAKSKARYALVEAKRLREASNRTDSYAVEDEDSSMYQLALQSARSQLSPGGAPVKTPRRLSVVATVVMAATSPYKQLHRDSSLSKDDRKRVSMTFLTGQTNYDYGELDRVSAISEARSKLEDYARQRMGVFIEQLAFKLHSPPFSLPKEHLLRCVAWRIQLGKPHVPEHLRFPRPRFVQLCTFKPVQALLIDLFWYIYCSIFQSGSEYLQDALLRSMSQEYALFQIRIKGNKDFFFDALPYALTNAIFLAFWYCVPASRGRYDLAFKFRIAVIIARLLSGVELAAVTVANRMEYYFPDDRPQPGNTSVLSDDRHHRNSRHTTRRRSISHTQSTTPTRRGSVSQFRHRTASGDSSMEKQTPRNTRHSSRSPTDVRNSAERTQTVRRNSLSKPNWKNNSDMSQSRKHFDITQSSMEDDISADLINFPTSFTTAEERQVLGYYDTFRVEALRSLTPDLLLPASAQRIALMALMQQRAQDALKQKHDSDRYTQKQSESENANEMIDSTNLTMFSPMKVQKPFSRTESMKSFRSVSTDLYGSSANSSPRVQQFMDSNGHVSPRIKQPKEENSPRTSLLQSTLNMNRTRKNNSMLSSASSPSLTLAQTDRTQQSNDDVSRTISFPHTIPGADFNSEEEMKLVSSNLQKTSLQIQRQNDEDQNQAIALLRRRTKGRDLSTPFCTVGTGPLVRRVLESNSLSKSLKSLSTSNSPNKSHLPSIHHNIGTRNSQNNGPIQHMTDTRNSQNNETLHQASTDSTDVSNYEDNAASKRFSVHRYIPVPWNSTGDLSTFHVNQRRDLLNRLLSSKQADVRKRASETSAQCEKQCAQFSRDQRRISTELLFRKSVAREDVGKTALDIQLRKVREQKQRLEARHRKRRMDHIAKVDARNKAVTSKNIQTSIDDSKAVDAWDETNARWLTAQDEPLIDYQSSRPSLSISAEAVQNAQNHKFSDNDPLKDHYSVLPEPDQVLSYSTQYGRLHQSSRPNTSQSTLKTSTTPRYKASRNVGALHEIAPVWSIVNGKFKKIPVAETPEQKARSEHEMLSTLRKVAWGHKHLNNIHSHNSFTE